MRHPRANHDAQDVLIYGAITVGRSQQAGKVWLQHKDGEGGQFPAAAVAQVLRERGDLEAYFRKKF